MNDQKKLAQMLGTLSLFASLIMFGIGSTNDHLTELKDFFWIPLILSAVCFMAAQRK